MVLVYKVAVSITNGSDAQVRKPDIKTDIIFTFAFLEELLKLLQLNF